MKVHHFSIGAMRPYGGALFDGRTRGLAPADLVCHCLLLETAAGLVLVDTGLVGADAARSMARISPAFRVISRTDLPPDEAAVHQIRRLGHDPADVRHIVLTHLDFDHVGGLPDFPLATVHVARAEAQAAKRATSLKERARYRTVNRMERPNWQLYGPFAAEFFGIPASYLDKLPGLMLVWLPGHTHGHCGVAIDLGRGQWLLHAGDAILNGHELDPAHPSTPTAARLLQWSIEANQRARRRSLAALRRIDRDLGDHVEILCSHDPALLARSATEQGGTPRRVVLGGG